MTAAEPFSTRLRATTLSDHRHAEASVFMTDLLAGRLSRSIYAQLLEQLQPVYAALDAASAAHRDDPRLGAFFDPRLARGQAIADDLRTLEHTPGETTAGTRAYLRRLDEVAADPLLVLAHHYTRYLGDLSGGRAIAATLERTMGLTAAAGLAFYQFDVGPAPRYKNAYGQRLDDLSMSRDDEHQFLTEVATAYSLNSQVFADLTALR